MLLFPVFPDRIEFKSVDKATAGETVGNVAQKIRQRKAPSTMSSSFGTSAYSEMPPTPPSWNE